jgi:hypothetical protein
MTERWQNELKKLRSLEAPDELRERVDPGPRGEGLPPTRQRVLAGVVAFAVFAGAGAFVWRSFAPAAPLSDVGGPPPEVTIDLPAFDAKRPGSASVGYLGLQRDVHGWLASAHGVVIPERFPTALPVGALVSVRSDGPPVSIQSARCTGWNVCDGPISDVPVPADGPSHLPVDPGIYWLTVVRPAPSGSADALMTSWAFQVQLIAEGVPAVTFMRDQMGGALPTALFLWDGTLTALRLGGDTSVSLGPAPRAFDIADFFTIPMGSTIVVAGDAEVVDGSIGSPQPPYTPIDALVRVDGGFPLHVAGRFVLSFDAGWDLRTLAPETATFFLPVDVIPAQASPTPTVEPMPNGVVVTASGAINHDADHPVDVAITIQVDGTGVDGAFGGSETAITFPDGTGTGSVGDPGVPRFRPEDFVAVSQSAPLTIRGNADELAAAVSTSRDPFDESQSFDPSAGHLPELSPGRHVLSFDATWELGPTSIVQHATAQLTMLFPIEIVPVASSTPAAEDLLRIDCSADPVVATPVVAAGRKGVDVRSPDGGNLEFKNVDTGQFLAWGTLTPLPPPDPGDRAVLPFDPGRWTVICGGNGMSAGAFRVIDPLNAFRSPALACPEAEQVALVQRVPVAPEVTSKEELIRRLLPGIRSSDVVELAGYPERSDAYLFRVVRAGSVIAAVEPDRDQVTGRGCAGTGVDFQAGAAA